jgi:WLM domain
MPNIAQLDPFQVQNISVLKRPNAQHARGLLEKCARQVQPILRRR